MKAAPSAYVTRWPTAAEVGALTQTTADGRYVRLSGGNMSGKLTIKTSTYGGSLDIVRGDASGGGAITYSNTSGVLGVLGVGGSRLYPNQPIFSQSPTGVVFQIWHSGNDGSGSGLDADLLDGKHYTDIINGNVTSATRLQTARTIWGQSFNGTANVSGDMTGVGSITMSGSLTVNNGITTGSITGQSGDHLYLDSRSDYDVGIRRSGSTSNGVSLGKGSFRPFAASAGIIDLGASSNRWRTIYSVNSLNTSSDLRLKDVHAAIPLTVAQVAAAPSFLYRWKKGGDKTLHAGSSAQYWKDVLPQAVERGADGYLAMEYDRIALASAIALAKNVVNIEDRVTILENENKTNITRLNAIEAVRKMNIVQYDWNETAL